MTITAEPSLLNQNPTVSNDALHGNTSLGPTETTGAAHLGSLVELLRIPAVLLDQKGQILAMNASMLALCDQALCIRLRRNCLLIQRNQVWEVFTPILQTPHPTQEHEINTHTLCSDLYRLIECPLAFGASAVAPWTLVYALGATPTAMPSLKTLQDLFQLTNSEARVAQLLLKGLCVKQIARQSQRSEYTIREHIKSVLQKTKSSGQSALVGTLASLPGRYE